MFTSSVHRSALVVTVLVAALALSACAPMPPYGYPAYPAYQAYRPQAVDMGVIEAVRGVALQAPDTGVGTVGGAALGGLAGSAVGAGAGNAAAIIGGAILGGIAGTAIERDANRRYGVELTVHTDSGRMVVIVQPDAGEAFRVGDRVRVISDAYGTRVTR